MRSSYYNIFVSLLVIFLLKNDLRPYFLFLVLFLTFIASNLRLMVI